MKMKQGWQEGDPQDRCCRLRFCPAGPGGDRCRLRASELQPTLEWGIQWEPRAMTGGKTGNRSVGQVQSYDEASIRTVATEEGGLGRFMRESRNCSREGKRQEEGKRWEVVGVQSPRGKGWVDHGS